VVEGRITPIRAIVVEPPYSATSMSAVIAGTILAPRAFDQQSRVPSRGALQLMSFEHVLRIITSGSMASMAKGRTHDELEAIAFFVTGRITCDSAFGCQP
jgi:hypothetical protein